MSEICSVEGCSKPGYRGTLRLCAAHDRRRRLYGSTDATPKVRQVEEVRQAFARMETADAAADGECWIWPGATNRAGYGAVNRHGQHLAHRAAWVAAHGSIPDGMHVCHRCDTPACYRLSHLFLGTDADNMADKKAKGRHFIGDGRTDGRVRYSDADIEWVRKAAADGWPIPAIAKQLGMNNWYAHEIVNGKVRTRPLRVQPGGRVSA